jgi:hypothetical protein
MLTWPSLLRSPILPESVGAAVGVEDGVLVIIRLACGFLA